jgi:8-oxo-dGTP pyrophosphatase MutT (NUDIX family)
MDPRIRLSENLFPEIAAAANPAEPRPAASVVMLRDGAGGLEVHLLMRAPTMAFAAGRPVFPGGRVDAADAAPIPDWTGPSPERWAADLGVDPATATAIVCAAVRETFEEAGVLLASPVRGAALRDLDSGDWRDDRESLSRHRLDLAGLLGRRELTLRSDWLKPWSVWVTPEFEAKRFHTWFLVARCPEDQVTLSVSSESTTSRWIGVEAAIRLADAGRLPLLPPQYCTCLELLRFDSVDQVLAADRGVPTIRPHAESDAEGMYLALPDDLVELGLAAQRRMYRS